MEWVPKLDARARAKNMNNQTDCLSSTKGDPTLRQIVWRDFACDMITNQNFDEVFADLARYMSQNNLQRAWAC